MNTTLIAKWLVLLLPFAVCFWLWWRATAYARAYLIVRWRNRYGKFSWQNLPYRGVRFVVLFTLAWLLLSLVWLLICSVLITRLLGLIF